MALAATTNRGSPIVSSSGRSSLVKRAGEWSHRPPPRSLAIVIRRPTSTPRNRSGVSTTHSSDATCLIVGVRGLPDEARDRLREPGRLILGDEGQRVLYPDQPAVGNRLGEALAVAEIEEAVLWRPGDKGRPVELPQPLRGLERVAVRDRPQELDRVPTHSRIGEEGTHPGVDHLGIH